LNSQIENPLFPRDETTGWTPAMIGAHHCMSVQHATTLRIVLEACGPVHPELLFLANASSFPNETRTAKDLAAARGHTAAVRLLSEADKRWRSWQEHVTGRPPPPTMNEKVARMRQEEHRRKQSHNSDEKRQERRANKERERRREERATRKKDREEEEEKRRRDGGDGGGGDGGGGDARQSNGKNVEGITAQEPKSSQRKRENKNNVQDSPEQTIMELAEAMKEVARLRDVLEKQRAEKDYWKRSCRQREDENGEIRRLFQKERKKFQALITGMHTSTN